MKEKEFNLRQKLVVGVMDLLLLAELSCSIFLGHQDPENMTSIFLRTFIPSALGTLVIGRICIRKLRSRQTAHQELAV